MSRQLNSVYSGKYIRDKRCELNLSQDELAKLLGISKTAVSNWENGLSIVDTKLLIPLSNIFCVTVDDILFPAAESILEYSHSTIDFKKMVSSDGIDKGVVRKTLELYIECKNFIIEKTKSYYEDGTKDCLGQIDLANRYGFHIERTSELLSEEITRKEKIADIEDVIESFWIARYKSHSHTFYEDYACQERSYNFQICMMNFIFDWGTDAQFIKYMKIFSQKYRNNVLKNYYDFAQRHIDSKARRTIKLLLRADCEYWIDGENRTIEVYQKCI